MARSAAERMASLRARQRRAGLTTLTLVVPLAEAAAFAALARRRRDQSLRGRRTTAGLALPRRFASRARRSAISSADIMRLRELLEITAIGLVIDRLNPVVESRLLGIIRWEEALDGDAASRDLQRFHAALGELSADPTLRFLLRVALRLTEEHSSFSGRSRQERDAGVARIRRVHQSIVAAILARDPPLAETHMRRYLAGLEDWLE